MERATERDADENDRRSDGHWSHQSITEVSSLSQKAQECGDRQGGEGGPRASHPDLHPPVLAASRTRLVHSDETRSLLKWQGSHLKRGSVSNMVSTSTSSNLHPHEVVWLHQLVWNNQIHFVLTNQISILRRLRFIFVSGVCSYLPKLIGPSVDVCLFFVESRVGGCACLCWGHICPGRCWISLNSQVWAHTGAGTRTLRCVSSKQQVVLNLEGTERGRRDHGVMQV